MRPKEQRPKEVVMKRGKPWASLLALLIGSSVATHAGENGPLDERFSIGLGAFFMSSDTSVRADAFESDDIGTPFNFEDTFGLDDDNVFRVDASWRMADRHVLRAMYFQSDRSRTAVLDRDIEFGDATFPLNAEVRGDFFFDITELAYEYVFANGDRYQLGGSFGIHNAGFRIGLRADLASPGGSASTRLDEAASTNAPLPVLGLRGRWRIAEDLYVLAHAQYFSLSFDSYAGDLQDYEAALVWQLSQHVGLGVAYNQFRTELETRDREHFEGRLRWRYSGSQLFMRMSF
jgi:hypothetical protein